jgi:hypothetical protein
MLWRRPMHPGGSQPSNQGCMGGALFPKNPGQTGAYLLSRYGCRR